MVASGTRNARAISGVLSPPISRSVSATCAAWPSAGWQQVKISRSRSSVTGPSSAGSSCRRRLYSVGWPPPHRHGERLLHRVLGQVDVAEDPGEDGHRAAILRPEYVFDAQSATSS